MSKRAVLLTSLAVLLLSYQNCSFDGAAHEDLPSTYDVESKGCYAPVAQLFATNYYPVFRQKCVDCHDTGAGFGHFANSDFNAAYDAFMSLGRATVEGNFVNPAHQPGHTGPQNQPIVSATRPAWIAAENQAALCSGGTLPVTTIDKSNPEIFTAPVVDNGGFFHIEWNLETEVPVAIQGKIHLILGIDVRQLVYDAAGVLSVKGYEFKNPVARLAPGYSGSYRIKTLSVRLNGAKLDKVTAYGLLDVTVGSSSNVALIPNGSAAPAAINGIPATNASDKFSLQVESLTDGDGTVIGGAPDPIPDQTIPDVVRFADLISSNPLLGVFSRNCISCHNSVNAAASLNLTSYAQAQAKAATIQSRMSNSMNPMPPGGLLDTTSRQVVNVWVNGGAPQ